MGSTPRQGWGQTGMGSTPDTDGVYPRTGIGEFSLTSFSIFLQSEIAISKKKIHEQMRLNKMVCHRPYQVQDSPRWQWTRLGKGGACRQANKDLPPPRQGLLHRNEKSPPGRNEQGGVGRMPAVS